MSANNWTICPKCKIKTEEDIKKQNQLIRDSYGKIPIDDYLKMVDQLNQPMVLRDNLREDYSIGITEYGQFHIKYSTVCKKCEFKFTFEHSEMII